MPTAVKLAKRLNLKPNPTRSNTGRSVISGEDNMEMVLQILMHVGILLLTVLAIVYAYFRKQYTYWKSRNIPCEPPSFPYGSLKGTNKRNFVYILREIYEKSKHERFYGVWFFYKPSLFINDLDLVKDILVKDFMHFHDRGGYHNDEVEPLSGNLAMLSGVKWRNIRTKLTPTFTSGKMKMMFSIMKDCSNQFKEVLQEIAEKGEVVEMKNLIARFTTDIIASCAFGIEANSLKNPDAIFRVMGRKLFEPSWNMYIRNFAAFVFPEIARFFKMRLIPKYLADFFMGTLRETIDFRNKNNVRRNDFLQLLTELMNKGYVEDADTTDKCEIIDKQKFTFEQAAAQAFIFFVGGFESSSVVMQFLLYELAMNQDVQEKLRQEIQESLAESNGEMNYENVHKMEYMGRVIDETMRLYSPGAFLPRICTKPYKIPGTDIVLEEGTSITIPACAFHMDERYFPNPDKFDPDRFSEEEKRTRNHYSFLPFGEGPRICIAQRFALMQIRVALVTILSNFRVNIAEGKTTVPVELDPKSIHIAPKGGMHLKISLL